MGKYFLTRIITFYFLLQDVKLFWCQANTVLSFPCTVQRWYCSFAEHPTICWVACYISFNNIVLDWSSDIFPNVELDGELGCIGKTNKWRWAIDPWLAFNSSRSANIFLRSSLLTTVTRYLKLSLGNWHLIMKGLLILNVLKIRAARSE